MASCSPEEIAADVARVIAGLFGHTLPEKFRWTESSFARARQLASVPVVRNEFIEDVSSTFRSILGNVDIDLMDETTGYTWGHAWAIDAFSEVTGVHFVLAMCGFYPVATLRPYTDIGYPVGLDRGWRLDVQDATRLQTIARFVARLHERLKALCTAHEYCYLPPDSVVFQQRVPAFALPWRKAWDYLFFVGPLE